MGWLEKILGKLVEIVFKPKADQMGILNVKTESKTYNVNLTFTTSEASRAFAGVFAAGNEAKIAEGAEKLLSANSATLNVLPMSIATEIASASLVASAAAASGIMGQVKIGEDSWAVTGVGVPEEKKTKK